MNLDLFIITVFWLVDDGIKELLQARPAYARSAALSICGMRDSHPMAMMWTP